MECPLCGHQKTHKHGRTSKGSQRHYCPACRQTFTETFDTLYYRRQVEPEKIRMVLQAHSSGCSLRGISRTINLAYNTVSRWKSFPEALWLCFRRAKVLASYLPYLKIVFSFNRFSHVIARCH